MRHSPKVSYNITLWGVLATFQSGNVSLLRDVFKTREWAREHAGRLINSRLPGSDLIVAARVKELSVTPIRTRKPRNIRSNVT
jgi:hypothetical protein